MAFTTPCFVRVNDASEREELMKWLKRIGYKDFGNPFQSYSSIVYTTVDGYYVNAQAYIDNSWIDCGRNVELFKALAAMNDENCLYQWFTDGHNWGICEDEYWAIQVAEWDVEENDEMFNMAISPQCHKAAAEEIVEHFKKRG